MLRRLMMALGGGGTNTFAKWNPLDKGSDIVLSSGDTVFEKAIGTTGWNTTRSVDPLPYGKWYHEFIVGGTVAAANNDNPFFGLLRRASALTSHVGAVSGDFGFQGNSAAGVMRTFAAGSATNRTGTIVSGERVKMAVDMAAGRIWFGKVGGVWINSGDPAAGTGVAISFTAPVMLYLAGSAYTDAYTGTSAGAYLDSVPSGFVGVNSITKVATPTAAFSNVNILLHGDGTDGATTITDQKGNTWTAGGNARIRTAESLWGGSSLYFDGNSDYFSCSSGMGTGTSDFMIEAWIHPISLSTRFTILDQRGAGNTNGTLFFVETNGAIALEMRSSSPLYTGGNAAAAASVVTGRWQHVAVSRQGNVYRFFLNGIMTGEFTNASGGGNYTFGNTSARIGYTNDSNAAYAANGYVEELRRYVGGPVYTQNFEVPTGPFPDS